MEFKHCKRCGIRTDMARITILDKQGICNHCRAHERYASPLTNFDKLQKVFEKAINTHKGKYEYDVAVGFSGGKDSSYLCYALKNKYNCRVLAVTTQFSFMPSGPAIENMRRVTESLGIDHVVVDLQHEEISKGFASSIKKELNPCPYCFALTMSSVRRIAIERNIPCYIEGFDRGQFYGFMPPSELKSLAQKWDQDIDLYEMLVSDTIKNENNIENTRKQFYKKGLSKEYVKKLFPDMKMLPGTNIPSIRLMYFFFHPYEEKVMKKALREEAGWQQPENDQLHYHHDCELHDAVYYAQRKLLGVSRTFNEICVDVREGQLTRHEAIFVIDQENEYLDGLSQPYDKMAEISGLQVQEIKQTVSRGRYFIKTMALKNWLKHYLPL